MRKVWIGGVLVVMLVAAAGQLCAQEDSETISFLPPDSALFIRFKNSSALAPKLDALLAKIDPETKPGMDQRFIARILKKNVDSPPLAAVDTARSWMIALLDMQKYKNPAVLVIPVSNYRQFLDSVKNTPEDIVTKSGDCDVIQKGPFKFYITEHKGYAFVSKVTDEAAPAAVSALAGDGPSLLEDLKAAYSASEMKKLTDGDVCLFINMPAVYPFISSKFAAVRRQMTQSMENPQIPEQQKKYLRLNMAYMDAIESAVGELDKLFISTNILTDGSCLFNANLKIKDGGTLSTMTKGHTGGTSRTLALLPDDALLAMGTQINPASLKSFYEKYFRLLSSMADDIDESAIEEVTSTVSKWLDSISGDMAVWAGIKDGRLVFYEIVEHKQGVNPRAFMKDYIAQVQTGAFKQMMQEMPGGFEITYKENIEIYSETPIDAIEYTFKFPPEMQAQSAFLQSLFPGGKMTAYVVYPENLMILSFGKDISCAKTLIDDVRDKKSLLLKNPKISQGLAHVGKSSNVLSIFSLSESAIALSNILGEVMKKNCLATQKQVEEASAKYRAAQGNYPADVFALYREKLLAPPIGMCALGQLKIDPVSGKVSCTSCGSAEAPSGTAASFPVPPLKLEKTGYFVKSVAVQPNSISAMTYAPIDEIVAMKEIIKATGAEFRKKRAAMRQGRAPAPVR